MTIIAKIKTTLQHLLETDTYTMPLWRRVPLRGAQILYASARDITDGQLSLQAMSLVYTTLITIVPLLAISFSVLKGFGVHNQVEPMLLNFLEGLGQDKSREIADRIIDFVDNVKVGVLGAVGLGFLIYAVIGLMQKIENAFNYIWRVGQDRTLAKRFSDYLSVLLVGPLLIFVSAGITGTVRHSAVVHRFIEYSTLGPLLELGSFLVPWLVMALGLSFIYVYMPNTKVRLHAAFIGAMVSALLWKVMSWVFAAFIASSAKYVAIYAAFATLIVFMLWLYAIWLIILIGANISFYIQYPRYLRVSRAQLILTPYLTMTLGLNALSVITQGHYNDGHAYSIDELSKKLNAPILAIQTVMALLETGDIVTTSSEEEPRYYPACPFDKTPLQAAIDVLEKTGAKGWIHTQKMISLPATARVMEMMNEARKAAITTQPIKTALMPQPASS